MPTIHASRAARGSPFGGICHAYGHGMADRGWEVAVEHDGKQWQSFDVKIDRASYPQMKAWFSRMVQECLPPELITPETNPVSSLEAIEARSPAKARAGLAMAIGDIIEDTDGWAPERLASTDKLLLRDGLPTLTEMRLSFSKVINRVVKRGSIKTDIEYYAVRNAAELSHGEAEDLWPLLVAYEHSQPRRMSAMGSLAVWQETESTAGKADSPLLVRHQL